MIEVLKSAVSYDLKKLSEEVPVTRSIQDFDEGAYGHSISLPAKHQVGERYRTHHNNLPFASALEKFRSDQKNLELSAKVVRVTKAKYEEGLVSSLELTQINDQYLQTLSSYTSSMVELLNSKINIDLLLNKI